MARKKSKMKDRHDIFDRYKYSTSKEQAYNANEMLCLLQHDSYRYFEKDSKAVQKGGTRHALPFGG